MGHLLKIICILAVLFVNDSLSQSIVFFDGSCVTPDGLQGTCIDIKQCPPLLNILTNVERPEIETHYLQLSQCGRNGKTVLVCCRYVGGSRFNIPTPAQTEDNSHLLPNTRQCGVSFDNRISGGNATKIDEYPWAALIEYTNIIFPNGSCGTPDGLQGTCIDLKQCPPLLNILKNVQRSETETRYLQLSQCGRNGKTVLVCCRYDGGSRFNVPTPAQTEDNSNLLPNTRQCGRSFDNRIYGGNVTKIDEYPWVALIEYAKPGGNRGHHCGAALINNRYVITAAHCVTGRGIPSNWNVSGIRLGEWDRSTNPDCEIAVTGKRDCADSHLDVGIEEIIYHPYYDAQSKDNLNDIALIRLDRYITYTDFVSPVCLPVQSHLRSKTFDSVKMDVTGWGTTEQGVTSALKLKAGVDGWPFERCRQKYGSSRIYLQDTQMCAGGEQGVDSCSGDSGGPLVVKERLDNRDVYVLSGVVSFGPKPCGLPGWPGVYTRVGAYIDWITNIMKA